MGPGAAHGVKVAGFWRLSVRADPLWHGERMEREANVNKHVFIEQKYVQHPLCPSLSDVGHGGKGTEEQFAPSPAAQSQGKKEQAMGGTWSCHTAQQELLPHTFI